MRVNLDQVSARHLANVIQHFRLHFHIKELVVSENDVHEAVNLVSDVRLALGNDALLIKCKKSRHQAYLVSYAESMVKSPRQQHLPWRSTCPPHP